MGACYLLGYHLDNVVFQFCSYFILCDVFTPFVAVVLQVAPRQHLYLLTVGPHGWLEACGERKERVVTFEGVLRPGIRACSPPQPPLQPDTSS